MMDHPCYMENGSIVNSYSGCIIEDPAILVSKNADTLHGWGNEGSVNAKFMKLASAYQAAGFLDDLLDLKFIQLNKFRISREMACYVIRRAVEYTVTGFITKFCEEIEHGDPEAFLKKEMERIPIDLNEKEWGR